PVDAAAGARRFGAEVEDLGPCREHAQAVLHGAGRIEPEAAVAERVGGEVEDAHDPRASSQLEGALARQAQGPGLGEGRGPHPGGKGARGPMASLSRDESPHHPGPPLPSLLPPFRGEEGRKTSPSRALSPLSPVGGWRAGREGQGSEGPYA